MAELLTHISTDQVSRQYMMVSGAMAVQKDYFYIPKDVNCIGAALGKRKYDVVLTDNEILRVEDKILDCVSHAFELRDQLGNSPEQQRFQETMAQLRYRP